MSVKIMGQVWELDLMHSELLILLALADHADHDGGHVFPSMGLVAWKTGYEERQVRRVVAKLLESGLLIEQESPIGKSRTFSINVAAGVNKQPFKSLTSMRKTSDKMSDPPRTKCPTPP